VLASGSGDWFAPIVLLSSLSIGKGERYAVVFSTTAIARSVPRAPISTARRRVRAHEQRSWQRLSASSGVPTCHSHADGAVGALDVSLDVALRSHGDGVGEWQSPARGRRRNTAELYDVATKTSSATASCGDAQRSHRHAAERWDGAGRRRRDNNGNSLSTAEVFDASFGGTFTGTANGLLSGRAHTQPRSSPTPRPHRRRHQRKWALSSVEMYDPSTRTSRSSATCSGRAGSTPPRGLPMAAC